MKHPSRPALPGSATLENRVPLSRFGSARIRFMEAMGRASGIPRWPERILLAPLREAVVYHDLPKESVDLAYELVLLEPELEKEDQETLLLLVLVCLILTQAGSTCVTLDEVHPKRPVPPPAHPPSMLHNVLRTLFLDSRSSGQMHRRIVELVTSSRLTKVLTTDPNGYTPLVLEGSRLYLQRALFEENTFVQALASHLKTAWVDKNPEEVAHALGQEGAALSAEQKRAVVKAVTQPFTVISGGPGTGKTFLTLTLVRLLMRLGMMPHDFALAAPTGKAAHRLADTLKRGEDLRLSACPQPVTLHRLLHYSPVKDAFEVDQKHPLARQVVIVDESSMVDLSLMTRLLIALKPGTRLILLGDASQIPSVNAGAVFRDLLHAKDAHSLYAVHLKKNFRVDEASAAGRQIIEVARTIDLGKPKALPIEPKKTAQALEFSGVELLDAEPDEALSSFLDTWHHRGTVQDPILVAAKNRIFELKNGSFGAEDEAHIEALFQASQRRRVLCLTKSPALASGKDAVNRALHLRWLGPAATVTTLPMAPGEPIIVERNDYERGLFNGDQGLVLRLRVGDETQPMAVFRTERGLQAFFLSSFGHEISLCHAITVHKAQGSEYDQVAVILPKPDLPLLTREMLYTAVTRSRNSVVVVGTQQSLERAIQKSVTRASGIQEKLARALS